MHDRLTQIGILSVTQPLYNSIYISDNFVFYQQGIATYKVNEKIFTKEKKLNYLIILEYNKEGISFTSLSAHPRHNIGLHCRLY